MQDNDFRVPKHGPTNEPPTMQELLRYIKRERDRYKKKLEKLTPYAKSLEAENKQLRINNKALKGRMSELEKQNRELTKDSARNPVYQKLLRDYVKLKQDNKCLFSQLSTYLGKEGQWERIWI